MSVPDAAAEAAAKAYYEARAGLNVWEDLVPVERLFWRDTMRLALEAAAPHMLAEAWESGMAAAKLQAAGIKPARNPYRSQDV